MYLNDLLDLLSLGLYLFGFLSEGIDLSDHLSRALDVMAELIGPIQNVGL